MSVYCVLLRFADKSAAPIHMAGHRDWIERGLSDGPLLLAGSLDPGLGGAVLAAGDDRAAIEAFIAEDPFVEHGVVHPEILEISPSRLHPRLAFLA